MCKNKQRHTREVEGLVHHELLTKANVAEVFLALANGNNFATLVEHFFYYILSRIFRKPTNKDGLAPWRSLSGGRRRKICKIHINSLLQSDCMTQHDYNQLNLIVLQFFYHKFINGAAKARDHTEILRIQKSIISPFISIKYIFMFKNKIVSKKEK